ncbi:MAG: hypothetical protein LBJ74_05630 [Heliobacteriaceae bacterium]|nr:hypothetical protein [Heliobacteriaceae bacterium]
MLVHNITGNNLTFQRKFPKGHFFVPSGRSVTPKTKIIQEMQVKHCGLNDPSTDLFLASLLRNAEKSGFPYKRDISQSPSALRKMWEETTNTAYPNNLSLTVNAEKDLLTVENRVLDKPILGTRIFSITEGKKHVTLGVGVNDKLPEIKYVTVSHDKDLTKKTFYPSRPLDDSEIDFIQYRLWALSAGLL